MFTCKPKTNYSRKILVAIHICKNNPTLNQDRGLELDPTTTYEPLPIFGLSCFVHMKHSV